MNNKFNDDNKVFSWGLSMYGGYYANYFFNGEYDGIHFEKKRDLVNWSREMGFDLSKDRRIDN